MVSKHFQRLRKNAVQAYSRDKGFAMNNLRERLQGVDILSTTDEYRRVLNEWDIPSDESLTAQAANIWLQAHIICSDVICVTDCMTGEE